MKRLITIAVTVVVASMPATVAAQASSTVSLAEIARKEEARRKTARKATKVFTNANLSGDGGVPSRPAASQEVAGAPDEPTIPLSPEPPPDPGEAKDQAYWQKRISDARTTLTRTQTFADAMQSKINALRTDFTSRDDRVAREKIQVDLNNALAELDRLRKEMDVQTKAIAAIEDEARRANVPSGWLRPGA